MTTDPIYLVPPDVKDLELRRREAGQRRKAMVAAGCQTYALGFKGGQPSIVCLCCGLGSVNPHDLANTYCGFCAEFHAKWKVQP